MNDNNPTMDDNSITYTHEIELAPDVYHMKWGFQDDMIGFHLTVKTTGWIGFGISPYGGMKGADIFTAWVGTGLQTFLKEASFFRLGDRK